MKLSSLEGPQTFLPHFMNERSYAILLGRAEALVPMVRLHQSLTATEMAGPTGRILSIHSVARYRLSRLWLSHLRRSDLSLASRLEVLRGHLSLLRTVLSQSPSNLRLTCKWHLALRLVPWTGFWLMDQVLAGPVIQLGRISMTMATLGFHCNRGRSALLL